MFWTSEIRAVSQRCGACLVVALWIVAVLPPLSFAQGCPPNSEAYSEQTQGKTTIVRCRCLRGYTNFRGECRLVEEVRTRLEERLKNAQAGGRAALSAWAQLGTTAVLERVNELIGSLDLLLTVRGREFSKKTAEVEVKLAELLSGMRDCSYSNAEMWTSCENIHTFIRLVHETREQLDRLPQD